MEQHKMIAIYGNSGSYKTTTSISLARAIGAKDKYANIIIVGNDATKPLLPIIAPFESKFTGSIGRTLSVVDFSEDAIYKNIYMATDRIGVLSYNIRENANTYALVSHNRIDDLYVQLRRLANYIIIDCTSDVSRDVLTAKAIINADEKIELLTCDLNGLVFDGSQEPILQSEQYSLRNTIRLLALDSRFKQDEAAMTNALGRISGKIPYSSKVAEYLNQGVLLAKGTDDGNYNRTINSIADLLMKEDY
ncbi:MAG: hypothetical protein ACI4JS_06340 [Oscillospiraceae bacterium]